MLHPCVPVTIPVNNAISITQQLRHLLTSWKNLALISQYSVCGTIINFMRQVHGLEFQLESGIKVEISSHCKCCASALLFTGLVEHWAQM